MSEALDNMIIYYLAGVRMRCYAIGFSVYAIL